MLLAGEDFLLGGLEGIKGLLQHHLLLLLKCRLELLELFAFLALVAAPSFGFGFKSGTDFLQFRTFGFELFAEVLLLVNLGLKLLLPDGKGVRLLPELGVELPDLLYLDHLSHLLMQMGEALPQAALLNGNTEHRSTASTSSFMPIIFNKKKRSSQEQIRIENLDVIYNRAALNDIQISAAQTLHSSFTPVRLHMSEITELLQALVSGDRQNNRLIRLSFPRNDAPSGALMVANRLDASEGLSRDFRYTVEVLSDDPRIPLKDVLGKMVTLELNHDDGSVRYFNGYVFDFRFARNDGGFSIYGMVLLPWMAFLRYRRNNKLFHGMSVEQQTSEIFAQHASSDWKITHLSGDSVMTDACQFDESDYNYLHRRWEALGWHYHYEHRADGHTLVLSADSTAAHPIDGTGEVQWVSDSGVVERGLKTLSPVRTVASTHYSTSSFDFKKPRPAIADVPTRNEQGLIPELEVYEYAGAYGFKDADDGRDFVTRRMEEIEAAAKHFKASGDAESVLPGRSFKLVGHVSQYLQAAEEAKNEFLVVDVQHSASNNYELQQGATSEYRLSLHCLRKSIPWRPGQQGI